ncbi:hypothetical protein A1O3_10231 [Capronia epimyces CBS 606.96]|uniref:Fe2OG dioxygenase domain-containing protein n=1 Tax=Capronia epimyces CBS 606.96 TaxID=1182542 RepID=W9XA26_9EURO|nr:uncharacterized protein A1O3_10231 [Capronia epimyces CBS 606.96]EXJ77073.1 hypothetical protein A1O3_10231 [Capronia epimyces CBS 606.96]
MPSATLPVAHLPIIDFSLFTSGSPEQRLKTAREVVDAFKTAGFVYLVNHTVPDELVDECFQWSKKVFQLPQSELTREEVIRPQPGNGAKSYIARGYTPVGREKVSQDVYADDTLKSLRQVEDVKELYDIGADKGAPAVREPNRFPPRHLLPGFEDFMINFFWRCHEFGLDIFRAIAIGLGLDEDYFVNFHQDADHLFRLIHYPAVSRKALASGQKARIPAHSDFGSITILFQDQVGGLQVEDRKNPGSYLPASPIKGSAIVNIGDFLMRWSNDVLKSTLHRVIEPPADGEQEAEEGNEMTQERFSVPFFLQADRHKMIQCVPGLEGETGPKFPPITAMEYLAMRTDATFRK